MADEMPAQESACIRRTPQIAEGEESENSCSDDSGRDRHCHHHVQGPCSASLSTDAAEPAADALDTPSTSGSAANNIVGESEGEIVVEEHSFKASRGEEIDASSGIRVSPAPAEEPEGIPSPSGQVERALNDTGEERQVWGGF